MAVPYHTHTFEIPSATKADVEAGTRGDLAATPASLGSAATKDVSYFATALQGGNADTAVQSVNGKTGTTITLDKSDVGLGNVDNTSDLNKPVSTAQQSALNLKANSASLGSAAYSQASDFATAAQGAKADSAIQSVNGKTGNSVTLAKGDVGLGNVDNTADLAKPISTATQTALNGKASSAQGAKADTAIQPGDSRLIPSGGSSGQVLVKASNDDFDTEYQTIAAATAVSYAPQTLTEDQQDQARENINAMQELGYTPVNKGGDTGLKSMSWDEVPSNWHQKFTTIVTLAAGSNYVFAPGSGMVLVSEILISGSTGLFLCGGGQTVLIGQSGSIFGTDSGEIRLKYAPEGNYYLGNSGASSRQLQIAAFRTRDQS
ncbi:hypothetical protein ACLBWS_05670 [Brucellaceae bacterium D45D]